MREDSIVLFLEGGSNRAALQYQRINKKNRERTFWAKTVSEAIAILIDYRERLDIVSLGYNLSNKYYVHPASSECGMEIVRWLERQNSKKYSHVRFIVHTWDTAGRKMVNRLWLKGYRVIYVPFGL